MDKYLSCWKITGKCYYVALDETDEGAMRKLAEHVAAAHQIHLTAEMLKKAKAVMGQAA